jgi:hypothetical protein
MDHDLLLPAPRRRYGQRRSLVLEASVIDQTGFGEHWDRLADVQRSAEELLSRLDELALHQAAAYVSMALDAMREVRPDPLPSG